MTEEKRLRRNRDNLTKLANEETKYRNQAQAEMRARKREPGEDE